MAHQRESSLFRKGEADEEMHVVDLLVFLFIKKLDEACSGNRDVPTTAAVFLPLSVQLDVVLCAFLTSTSIKCVFYCLDFPYSRKKGETFSTRHSLQTGTWQRQRAVVDSLSTGRKNSETQKRFLYLFRMEITF